MKELGINFLSTLLGCMIYSGFLQIHDEEMIKITEIIFDIRSWSIALVISIFIGVSRNLIHEDE